MSTPFAMKVSAIAALMGLSLAARVEAAQLTYYLGVDQHPILNTYQHADNTYVGLANPNYNRLTFLYAHWMTAPIQASHYHGMSNYFYSGPVSAPTIINTTANNVLPEAYTGFPPMGMRLASSGIYSGKFTSYAYEDQSEDSEGHYSNLTTGTTTSLMAITNPAKAEYWIARGNKGTKPDGSAETVGKYSAPLTGTNIGILLVNATPGLHMGIGSTTDISVGTPFTLGDATTLEFTPTFWVEADAEVKNYTATLQFIDLNSAATGVLPSGLVSFQFTNAIPEPAIGLAGMTLLPLLSRRRSS